MTDLVEEVRECFKKSGEEQDDGSGRLQIIDLGDKELVPGFNAIRHEYGERLHRIARRGYHHYAGASLPSNADELLVHTGDYMMSATITACLAAFSDGVLIGQRENHMVKMCLFFDVLEHLFHDEDYLESVHDMATGFGNDRAVYEFFAEYVTGGLNHISHATGFAHCEEVPTHKVWDVWLLTGTATTAASYLAGFYLGNTWRERDVLDGIQIATERNPSGSEDEG